MFDEHPSAQSVAVLTQPPHGDPLTPYVLRLFNSFGAERASVRLMYDDDEQAIRAISDVSQGHRMELWQGERLVKKFAAGPISDQTDHPS